MPHKLPWSHIVALPSSTFTSMTSLIAMMYKKQWRKWSILTSQVSKLFISFIITAITELDSIVLWR